MTDTLTKPKTSLNPLHETVCAICNTFGNATELYSANFNSNAFNATVFSARRLPDRIRYRVVRCNTCGLVRSDPVIDSRVMADLYVQSSFDYSNELNGLRKTYGRYLSKIKLFGGKNKSLLEIGCGNGFFLKEAIAQGYLQVVGVEPSVHACNQADASLKDYIVCDIMRPGLFEENSFDTICFFQVFDHIPAPNELLAECFRVLKPGGFILFLNHNVESFSARVLKEKSPIIDVEHTYLYTSRTLSQIIRKHNFKVRSFGTAWNLYSLHYLVRLLPLSQEFKHSLLRKLKTTALGRIQIWVPLGNLYLLAQKPAS